LPAIDFFTLPPLRETPREKVAPAPLTCLPILRLRRLPMTDSTVSISSIAARGQRDSL
jgi:hypothetical protein